MRVTLLLVAAQLALPAAGARLDAQFLTDTVRTSEGPVQVTRPVIVLFNYGRSPLIEKAADDQVLRLRDSLRLVGVEFVERRAPIVDYVVAGGSIRWSARRDQSPQGYLFLLPGGLTTVRYGLLRDKTLREAVDVWWPPRARIAIGNFGEVRSRLEAEVNATRRCVDVAAGPARSGEFTVRGFESYATLWHRGGSKLMWFPSTPRAGDTLTVRVVNAQQFDDSASFRFGEAVRARGGGALMFPSGVRIPRPGPWFLVARAGNNWGCFLFVLPDAR